MSADSVGERLDYVSLPLWFAHGVVLVLWVVGDVQKETQPCGCVFAITTHYESRIDITC